MRYAVPYQRKFAIEEEKVARPALEEAGCEITEQSEINRPAFKAAVAPLMSEARDRFGADLFDMLR